MCVCVHECVCVHVYRQAGWQATVTTWQQPTTLHFWPRQALQLQKPALPKAPSFPLNRWDDWAASSDTHTHTRMPVSPPLFLGCTCLPALQASSTPIKGAELFSSRKLIQHLSPGFIQGIEDCVLHECECKSTMCVWQRVEGRVCVFKRGRQCVFLLDQEQKRNIVCVALLCKDLRMDIWRLQGRLYSFRW